MSEEIDERPKVILEGFSRHSIYILILEHFFEMKQIINSTSRHKVESPN